MQTANDLNERILKLSMIDTARNSMIALPVIMLFEIYMIISWIVNVDDKMSTSSLCYFIGYIIMFSFCAFVLFFMRNYRKEIDRNSHKINRLQHILAFIFILWSVFFTYVGSELRGHFDYLIFITFVTVIPLFCYMNPIYWILLQLSGTGFIYYFASHHDRFFAFLINFTVFTLISLVAGWTMHYIRRFGYLRQIELEDERNYAYELAHKDPLTGLPNRHSCDEALAKLSSEHNNQDIILVVCDVNGLKAVNDQLGHEAGDELLQGAAVCLQQTFQKLGTVYRVGGDEFTGILRGTDQELQDAIREFEQITSTWKGKIVKHLSISIGYSMVQSDPSASINKHMIQADNAMYKAKREYYLTHEHL